MKNLIKLITILSITLGFAASVSASRLHDDVSGIMELPTFYIYASDEEASSDSVNLGVANWTFVKALDTSADRVAIEVILPGAESVQVYTPSIVTSLIES